MYLELVAPARREVRGWSHAAAAGSRVERERVFFTRGGERVVLTADGSGTKVPQNYI